SGGNIAVAVNQPMVSLSPMVLGVDLHDCPGVQGLQHLGVSVDHIVASIADHFRPQLESLGDNVLQNNLAPAMQDFLQSQTPGAQQGQGGQLLGFQYAWALDQLSVAPEGLDAYLGLSLSYSGPVTQCGQGQASLTVPSGSLTMEAGAPGAPFDLG